MKPPKSIRIERTWVEGLQADWLTPADAIEDARLLYFHGGGYICGSFASHRGLVGNLAEVCGLPPLLIHVGDYEILGDDSTRLAERARAVGVDVTLRVWEGMWHVFQTLAARVPEARQSVDEVGAWVKARLVMAEGQGATG